MGTERNSTSDWGAIQLPNYVHRVYLIYYGPRGAHVVRTRRDGGCAHRRTQNSELGVRDSEFLSVVRSTVDGLRETCGTL